ncbi:9640_t:CDS:2, partial [Funneliformis geosporum]
MSKCKSCNKSYSTILLTAGKTVSEIYYKSFSYAWWIVSERNINDQIKLLVPINLSMETLTKLKGRDFIITVLEPDIRTLPSLRYQAIYLFGIKTKFSGPLVMEFDQQVIVEELLKNIQFQPFEISIERFQIIVFGIAVSKNKEWNYT